MKVLSLGPDKDLLKQGSASCERHRRYAQHVEEYHAVVFARKEYGTKRVQIAENAWSYPTGSSSTVALLIDAYRTARRIVQADGEWVISVQDPFESGLIGYLLSKTTGAPLLIQEHGDFFSTPYWKRESLVNRVRYQLGRWLIRRADHVRVVSSRIQDTLVKLGVPSDRISRAPVYTDVAAFSDAAPDPTITGRKPRSGVLILTMARFVPQKNLSLLIRAFGLVLKQGVKAHLVIVGKGPQRYMLERLARDVAPDAVTFLEWTDNPAGAIQAADIYALSSNYEGWGRVLVEALAAGTPIVTTDVGCAGEVMCHEENGLVVPVGDQARFAAALHVLAAHATLRGTLAERGRQTVQQLPSIDTSIAAYISSLRACLEYKQQQSGQKLSP